jgi:hypothetical protein
LYWGTFLVCTGAGRGATLGFAPALEVAGGHTVKWLNAMSVFLMHPITMFSYDKFGEEQIAKGWGLSVYWATSFQILRSSHFILAKTFRSKQPKMAKAMGNQPNKI